MKLQVIFKGKYNAGVLWRDESGYHFEYDDEFISNEHTFPISVNMPKSQKRFDADRLFANFQAMLSEGFNRELQCRALGIDMNDDWSLLMYTCEKDTIGAITIKRREE
jgi:HipA-like protein